jgi:hypothetical protein
MARCAKMLALCGAMMLSGCNYGGALLHSVEGPKEHKAEYLPPKEPMAVLVENYSNGSGARLDADQIAAFLSGELKLNHVAPIVAAAKVYELRVSDPARFHAMSIAAVGKAVGAKQVLYVDVQTSTIEGPTGGESMKGALTGRVKVVDVKTGETRWPADSEGGYPLEYATPWLNHSPETNEMTMKEKLNRSVADTIARLFYTWKEEE